MVKEAGTLANAGYAVTVLTVRNHPAAEQLDLELMKSASFSRVTVDALPQPGVRSFFLRLETWIARKLAERFDLESFLALGPARALLRMARSIPSDLTIVHNEIPHWIGTKLLETGRKVAADIEDWHSEDLLPQARRGRPTRALRQVERTLLHKAVYCSTTSEALADGLNRRYGGMRAVVITNSFPLQTNPRQARAGEIPSFFWFSQTIGPGRGLEQFFLAWATSSRPSRVVLLGEAQGNYASKLLGSLPALKRELVSFIPLVPPNELPAIISRHDIGLALEQASIVNRDLTITNKIIQYLNAGLAIVASDTQGQREVIARSPNVGIVVDTADPVSFSAALDRLLADPAALVGRQKAARSLAAAHYCWEIESERLLMLVAQLIGCDGRSRLRPEIGTQTLLLAGVFAHGDQYLRHLVDS